jgi:F-type H+-transporting ATPase subunit b
LEALGINLGYLISQIFNFTLLAVLLYFVAYKPILRMLDERSARIKKGLDDAEAASRRAAEMEQEFEARMSEARKEGQEIIAQATQMSEQARQEILDTARKESRAQIERQKKRSSASGNWPWPSCVSRLQTYPLPSRRRSSVRR